MQNELKDTNNRESWDLEIGARTKFFSLNLNELWRYRDLIVLFVKRDFQAQYKQTILGPLWHLIQPILTTLMYMLVFGRIAKIPTDGIKPLLFYMAGFTIWNYFATCLTSISSTFVTNANIFGKVYFPRLVIPISIVISNLIRFGIQFGLLFAMMAWYAFNGEEPINFTLNWFWIPLFIFLIAGLGLGMGIIISSLTNKYRDLSVLLSFAVQLGMYATPVVYPLSFLMNSKFHRIISINPLTSVIEAFRYSLFGKGTFEPAQLIYSSLFMFCIIIVGIMYFNKVEKTFMDTV